MYEETTLGEVDEYGEQLELLDGQRFEVNPSDAPTVITWTPTTQLEITKGGKGRFPVKIRHVVYDRTIQARVLR